VRSYLSQERYFLSERSFLRRNCARAPHLHQSIRFSPKSSCALSLTALTWMLSDCHCLKGYEMSLTIRKTIVLGLIGVILLLSNILFVANWLAERGVIDWARNLRTEYLTGTAITIVAVLLILLVNPRRTGSLVRRCPVCDHVLLARGSYCSECGSKAS
jgi:hypothetical protein